MRLSADKGFGSNRRALRSYGRADGHEEAAKCKYGSLNPPDSCVPKGGGGAQHILPKCPKHAIRAWAKSDDVCCAEDESDNETNT